MFCGGLPCRCDGGAKRKKQPSPARPARSREKKSVPISDSAGSGNATDIDFGAIPEPAKPKFKSKTLQDRDLSYESALRILRPIVSDADKRKIDKELSRHYPQEVDRRIADWKDRHGTSEPVRFKVEAPKADRN